MIQCETIPEEEKFDIDDIDNSLSEIINLFYQIYKIVYIYNEHYGEINHEFQNYVYKNILHVDEKEHLPIDIFSYIAPTISTSFIFHIMLLMGSFEI